MKFKVGDTVRHKHFGVYADQPGKVAYPHTAELVGRIVEVDRVRAIVAWNDGSVTSGPKRRLSKLPA